MPGGYLSFGIYQKLGGEREFGAFWLQLGLPTIAAIATCYVLVVQRIISQRTWIIGSAGLVSAMALAVNARILL
mgnify:CR=1 FL=1